MYSNYLFMVTTLLVGLSGVYYPEKTDSLLNITDEHETGVAAIIAGINDEAGTLDLRCFPKLIHGNNIVVVRNNVWPDKFKVSIPTYLVVNEDNGQQDESGTLDNTLPDKVPAVETKKTRRTKTDNPK